jgi:hypothetical protein
MALDPRSHHSTRIAAKSKVCLDYGKAEQARLNICAARKSETTLECQLWVIRRHKLAMRRCPKGVRKPPKKPSIKAHLRFYAPLAPPRCPRVVASNWSPIASRVSPIHCGKGIFACGLVMSFAW